MRLIIDSHLDLAWNALSWKRDITRPVVEINAAESALHDHRCRGNATTSLPEMRRGGVGLCLATLLARAPTQDGPIFDRGDLDFRTPDMAYASARGQLAYYQRLEERGELRVVTTTQELEAHWESWAEKSDPSRLPVGAIIAMEGSDGIVDPDQVPHWYGLGLRVASLVHYGRNAYAGGTGDDTPLSTEGRELLAAFERSGIILDVTHLCDRSFDGALDAYEGPLLASHSNCRALVPHDRQFTDDQLRRLLGRGAVIGLAFDAWMLYPEWVRGETSRQVVTIEAVADHLDHIVSLAGGVSQVAIGTDLDGGYGTEQTPLGLDTIADLERLEAIFGRRGYSSEEIDLIFHGNWLRFFREHLPPVP